MAITHKTMAALVAVFLALLAGAALILTYAVQPEFARVEASMHARNQARLVANLSAIGADIRSRTIDYAHWDDTYSYIAAPNEAYTADFSDAWYDEYNADVLIFADNRGRPIWSRIRHPDGQFDAAPGSAAPLIAQARGGVVDERTALGVTWVDDIGPIIFAAAAATNNSGEGRPRGLVIMGRRLSGAALSEQVQLQLALIPADEAPAALADRFEALETTDVLNWTDSDYTRFLLALRDPQGRLTGALLARQSREVSALGARSTQIALTMFMVMSALATAALWWLLRGAVIAPIQRLERHFNAQSRALEKLAVRRTGKDEIVGLTVAYNSLVQRLREAGEREHDANAKREAEAAANRMKSDFLANISHELRTPLNAVIGYSELIEEDLTPDSPPNIREDLARITGAARSLLGLINEVLDLSRVEAGRIEMKPHAFNVDAMLNDVVAIARPLAEESGCTLLTAIPAGIGEAYSDQQRLEQSLVNVISEACRRGKDGVVELRAERIVGVHGDTLKFEIHDDGAKLSDGDLARIFEPFARADASAARRYGGSGLGLAITRKVMLMLGGAVEVISADGRGTTFVLTAAAAFDDSASPRALQSAA